MTMSITMLLGFSVRPLSLPVKRNGALRVLPNLGVVCVHILTILTTMQVGLHR